MKIIKTFPKPRKNCYLDVIGFMEKVKNCGNACNRTAMDRTSSMSMSVLRLYVDKGQVLRSRILFFTSLVLPPNEC